MTIGPLGAVLREGAVQAGAVPTPGTAIPGTDAGNGLTATAAAGATLAGGSPALTTALLLVDAAQLETLLRMLAPGSEPSLPEPSSRISATWGAVTAPHVADLAGRDAGAGRSVAADAQTVGTSLAARAAIQFAWVDRGAAPPTAAAPAGARTVPARDLVGEFVAPRLTLTPRAVLEGDHRGGQVKAFVVDPGDGRLRIVLLEPDWSEGLAPGRRGAAEVADALNTALRRSFDDDVPARVEVEPHGDGFLAIAWRAREPVRVASILDNPGFVLLARPGAVTAEEAQDLAAGRVPPAPGAESAAPAMVASLSWITGGRLPRPVPGGENTAGPHGFAPMGTGNASIFAGLLAAATSHPRWPARPSPSGMAAVAALVLGLVGGLLFALGGAGDGGGSARLVLLVLLGVPLVAGVATILAARRQPPDRPREPRQMT